MKDKKEEGNPPLNPLRRRGTGGMENGGWEMGNGRRGEEARSDDSSTHP